MTPPETKQNIGALYYERYEITNLPDDYDYETAPICVTCGGVIVEMDGRWYAPKGRWPNLAHCFNSAINGDSIPHRPDLIS